jgi:hypothetical protein
MKPGSPEWLKVMTASKVAAVLGVSPWESAYSLWTLMKGLREKDPQNDRQARGHYLEPAILHWFTDEHPEFDLTPGTFRTKDGWMGALPDACGGDDEWGTQGTDEVPTYYIAQAQWQMAVTGLGRVYMPLLTTRLRFVEYIVNRDQALIDTIVHKARAFMDSLAGDQPPPIDAHPATYESLRRVHPDIHDDARELPAEVAQAFLYSKHSVKDSEKLYAFWRNKVADLMGDAKKATCEGHTIAVRQSKNGGAPFVAPARNAPTLKELAEGAAA